MKSLLAGGAAAGLSQAPGPRSWARAAPPAIGALPITDQLSVFSGAGANVVCLRGADGLLLVDGGLEERSKNLLDSIRAHHGTNRVKILFNTHWHPEQTGSNQRLAGSDLRIISHENTKLWLGYKNSVAWENRTYGPLPPKARPNDTTYGSGSLMFGDEPVEYGYLLQAHTDGDLYVKFTHSNVLVTGGAVSEDGWPVIDYETGGWLGGLVDGVKALLALADVNTHIVPANGPVMTRAELELQRDMYATIFDRLGKLLRKGMGPDEVVAAQPTKDFKPEWGDPTQFIDMAFKSLWGHFAPDA
jgi:glyoxylase-like metal-dependent hydrolase (beta-lactamase superfamily II)